MLPSPEQVGEFFDDAPYALERRKELLTRLDTINASYTRQSDRSAPQKIAQFGKIFNAAVYGETEPLTASESFAVGMLINLSNTLVSEEEYYKRTRATGRIEPWTQFVDALGDNRHDLKNAVSDIIKACGHVLEYEVSDSDQTDAYVGFKEYSLGLLDVEDPEVRGVAASWLISSSYSTQKINETVASKIIGEKNVQVKEKLISVLNKGTLSSNPDSAKILIACLQDQSYEVVNAAINKTQEYLLNEDVQAQLIKLIDISDTSLMQARKEDYKREKRDRGIEITPYDDVDGSALRRRGYEAESALSALIKTGDPDILKKAEGAAIEMTKVKNSRIATKAYSVLAKMDIESEKLKGLKGNAAAIIKGYTDTLDLINQIQPILAENTTIDADSVTYRTLITQLRGNTPEMVFANRRGRRDEIPLETLRQMSEVARRSRIELVDLEGQEITDLMTFLSSGDLNETEVDGFLDYTKYPELQKFVLAGLIDTQMNESQQQRIGQFCLAENRYTRAAAFKILANQTTLGDHNAIAELTLPSLATDFEDSGTELSETTLLLKRLIIDAPTSEKVKAALLKSMQNPNIPLYNLYSNAHFMTRFTYTPEEQQIIVDKAQSTADSENLQSTLFDVIGTFSDLSTFPDLTSTVLKAVLSMERGYNLGAVKLLGRTDVVLTESEVFSLIPKLRARWDWLIGNSYLAIFYNADLESYSDGSKTQLLDELLFSMQRQGPEFAGEILSTIQKLDPPEAAFKERINEIASYLGSGTQLAVRRSFEILLNFDGVVEIDGQQIDLKRLKQISPLIDVAQKIPRLNTISGNLIKELTFSEDPFGDFEKIKSIYLNENIPEIFKNFQIFKILYTPDRVTEILTGANSEKLSPYLRNFYKKFEKAEAVDKIYETFFADLVRISVSGGDQGLRSWALGFSQSDGLLENSPDPTDESVAALQLAIGAAISLGYDASPFINTNYQTAVEGLRYLLQCTQGQTINNRISEVFFGKVPNLELTSWEMVIDKMDTFRERAINRNIRLSQENGIDLVFGDYVAIKSMRASTYVSFVDSSIVAREFTLQPDSDRTPFDTDTLYYGSSVKPKDFEQIKGKIEHYGDMFILIDTENTVEIPTSNAEIFKSGVIDTNHYGIRTGIAVTDIKGIVRLETMSSEDFAKLRFDIAKNGVYIPIFNEKGALLFSPENFEQIVAEGIIIQVGDKIGSNPGGVFMIEEDGQLNKYYLKYQSSENAEQLHIEDLSNRLYRSLGVPVAETRIMHLPDQNISAHASRWIDNIDDTAKPTEKDMNRGFIADVLLANWDAQFGRNLAVDINGTVYRIDNGGTLLYSAKGERRELVENVSLDELKRSNYTLKVLSENVVEIDSMREAYPALSDYEITKQVAEMRTVFTDELIEAEVQKTEIPEADKIDLIRIIKARRDYLINTFGTQEVDIGPVVLPVTSSKTDIEQRKLLLARNNVYRQIQTSSGEEVFTKEEFGKLREILDFVDVSPAVIGGEVVGSFELAARIYNVEGDSRVRMADKNQIAAILKAETIDNAALKTYVPQWGRFTDKTKGYQHNNVLLGDHIADVISRMKKNPEFQIRQRGSEIGLYDEREQELTLIAALFHDIGKPTGALGTRVARDYNHNVTSAFVAKMYMQEWGYTDADIKLVTSVILYDGVISDMARGKLSKTVISPQELMDELGTSSGVRILRALNRADVESTVKYRGYRNIKTFFEHFFAEAESSN